jgi:hypothetical protein
MEPSGFLEKMSNFNVLDTRKIINIEIWNNTGFNTSVMGKAQQKKDTK